MSDLNISNLRKGIYLKRGGDQKEGQSKRERTFATVLLSSSLLRGTLDRLFHAVSPTSLGSKANEKMQVMVL